MKLIKELYDGCVLKNCDDFFRIFLDSGENHEICVYANEQQEPQIIMSANETVYEYDSLLAEDGKIYDIVFEARVVKNDEGVVFKGNLINNSEVRINEIQYPYIRFDKTYCEPEEEELFIPVGLGIRRKNPRKEALNAHSEYIAADYKIIKWSYQYPSLLSMSWYGIQSGDKFLYWEREDEKGEIFSFNNATNPRNKEHIYDMIVFVSSYPTLVKGESYCIPDLFAASYDGDWTNGAYHYKKWMKQSSWYKPKQIPDKIKRMTGWQRIIMKHQYGEIFLKYSDLPEVFKQGHKYGIDTLLVFGWWKGRFDNGYPLYEADPDMGGAEELKKAIKEIRNMGGYVILYSNGKLIDITSDFFKKYGQKACAINLDGVPYYERYPFGNNGTTLINFGYKTFATACFGSKEWRERLLETTDIKLSFEPDGVFFDQLGGNWSHMPLCFNNEHLHGNRASDDARYRISAIAEIIKKLPDEVSIGTEFFVDRYSVLFDYIHGCNVGNYISYDAFPYIQKLIFPETIISNRFTHDERDGYIDELNYSFIFGQIFDVSIYRGRMGGMITCTEYSSYIKKLIDLKEKYKKYFYEPTFCYEAELLNVPTGIMATKYDSGDGILYAFMNETDNDISFTYKDNKVYVNAHDIYCLEMLKK